MMIRIAIALLLACLALPARAQQFMELPPGTVMGNVTAQTNPGSAVSLPQLIAAMQQTGVPITGVGNISGLGTGVANWLATPSGANLFSALTTKTGSGSPVFGTAPNITSPTGIVKGDVGLGNVQNIDTTSASNVTTGTLPAGQMPALTGDCTTTAGTVATSCTKTGGVAFTALATAAVGQIPGNTTNAVATAGKIGEVISSNVLVGSAVALSTGVAANITSAALTAGHWQVSGNFCIEGATSTSVTNAFAGITSTTGTIPANANGGAYMASRTAAFIISTGQQATCYPIGAADIYLSGTTTYFMVGQVAFSASTLGGYGFLRALRVQ